VEVAPNAPNFTVTFGGSHVDTYPLAGSTAGTSPSVSPAVTAPKYAGARTPLNITLRIADSFRTLHPQIWSKVILHRLVRHCIKIVRNSVPVVVALLLERIMCSRGGEALTLLSGHIGNSVAGLPCFASSFTASAIVVETSQRSQGRGPRNDCSRRQISEFSVCEPC